MKNRAFYLIPYFFWIVFFVCLPVFLIVYQAFFENNQVTLTNFATFFGNNVYTRMTINSIIFAFMITGITFLISYPTAYILTTLKHKQLWLMLIVLPTWINLLLKAYAFIGLFSINGSVNGFLSLIGIGPKQILFTNFSFLFVACYIELPFMILPIFNALDEISPLQLQASSDLGANFWQKLRYVIFPLSLNGVKSGCQAVFIPSLSLFMVNRLIGGNRVITLGTAIEEHFLVTQNWGMGASIGVVLICAMLLTMFLTREGGLKREATK